MVRGLACPDFQRLPDAMAHLQASMGLGWGPVDAAAVSLRGLSLSGLQPQPAAGQQVLGGAAGAVWRGRGPGWEGWLPGAGGGGAGGLTMRRLLRSTLLSPSAASAYPAQVNVRLQVQQVSWVGRRC